MLPQGGRTRNLLFLTSCRALLYFSFLESE